MTPVAVGQVREEPVRTRPPLQRKIEVRLALAEF